MNLGGGGGGTQVQPMTGTFPDLVIEDRVGVAGQHIQNASEARGDPSSASCSLSVERDDSQVFRGVRDSVVPSWDFFPHQQSESLKEKWKPPCRDSGVFIRGPRGPQPAVWAGRQCRAE